MRKVAQFEKEKLALRFWGYLKQQEIDSSLEEDESLGTWTIWVADEDKIDFAIEKHKQFSINPDDPAFLSSIPKAQETVTDKPSPQKSRFQEFNLRERWKSTRYGLTDWSTTTTMSSSNSGSGCAVLLRRNMLAGLGS